MRLILMFTGIPVALLAALHWHWIKDQAIHCFVAEAIRSVWHAFADLRHIVGAVLSPTEMLGVLAPDPDAVLNWAMILAGFASLSCAVFAPKLRPALMLGGLSSLAVGMSRETARANSRQLGANA